MSVKSGDYYVAKYVFKVSKSQGFVIILITQLYYIDIGYVCFMNGALFREVNLLYYWCGITHYAWQ